MIFVTVGSRNYPFDRLFIELDKLCEEKVIKDEIFAQIGTTKYKPKNFKYKDFITEEEFQEKINSANYVISHGASGSIMKALNANKKVIAVTRLAKYNEHINDHQIQNNEAFAMNGFVIPVYEMSELKDAIIKIQTKKDNLKKWKNKDPLSIIKIIDKFIKDTRKNKKKKPKICLVSSSGGHYEQLVKLKSLYKKYDGLIVTEKTKFKTDSNYLMLQTDLKDKLMVFKMFWNFIYSLYIWIKERPDYVITTGTMVAFPFYIFSILFRKKFVFIETFGRANMPTVAGKVMEKHSDLFIVQWESQMKHYKTSIYGGCLY